MPDLHDDREHFNWRKAGRSLNNGACVEVASRAGIIAIRDSQDFSGLTVRYNAGAWRSFVVATKNGDLGTPATW